MKLYIHIGTEKTGSSFLQSYLANNKTLLMLNGVYYPKAYFHNQDDMMLKGKISGGNAYELISLIEKSLWTKIEQWLLKRYIKAKENNCDKVLLSNEVLISKFSEKSVLEKFFKITKSIGFIYEEMFLMIREPISQALSLYKHHSKRGMLPIEIWLREKYNLTDILLNFYNQSEYLGLKLKQYPYIKDSDYLANLLINEWLKLNLKIVTKDNIVNPSLTLSELLLLTEIRKNDKILATKYYDFMIQIEKKNKGEDQKFENYIKSYINNYMVTYNRLWSLVSKYMSKDSDRYMYQNVEINENSLLMTFTPIQSSTLATFVIYSTSSKFFRFKLYSKFKNILFSFIPSFLIKLKNKKFIL